MHQQLHVMSFGFVVVAIMSCDPRCRMAHQSFARFEIGRRHSRQARSEGLAQAVEAQFLACEADCLEVARERLAWRIRAPSRSVQWDTGEQFVAATCDILEKTFS